MKLCDFAQDLDRIISREEIDLEREVITANLALTLKRGQDIVIHNWEYKKKGD